MSDLVAWTDGSKRKLPDGAEVVGAGGWYSDGRHFAFRLGGEASVALGEMGALAFATDPRHNDAN
eukprot:3264131-Rhodomonas_salina.1